MIIIEEYWKYFQRSTQLSCCSHRALFLWLSFHPISNSEWRKTGCLLLLTLTLFVFPRSALQFDPSLSIILSLANTPNPYLELRLLRHLRSRHFLLKTFDLELIGFSSRQFVVLLHCRYCLHLLRYLLYFDSVWRHIYIGN